VTSAPTEHVVYPYLEEVNQSILRTVRSLARTSPSLRVLDVGCGYGALGQEFRRLGIEVWGIERDASAVALASTRLDRVIECDQADTEVIARELNGTRFDLVVFSDVLEHTPDPRRVVGAFTPYLAEAGRVIVSVPNVANWQTRLALLVGRFTYKDTGVLDRTHLRFFTKRSTVEFMGSCGLQVQSVDFTPMLVRALLPALKMSIRERAAGDVETNVLAASPLYRLYLRLVLPVERLLVRLAPGLLAFQIVVTAGRGGPSA